MDYIKKFYIELLFLFFLGLLLSSIEVYFITLLAGICFCFFLLFRKLGPKYDYAWIFIAVLVISIGFYILKAFMLFSFVIIVGILIAFNKLLFLFGPTIVLFLFSYILIRHFKINIWKKTALVFLISLILGINFKIPAVIDSIARERSKPIINSRLILNKKENVNLVTNVDVIDYGFSVFPCMCDHYTFPMPYPSNFGMIKAYKENIKEILESENILVVNEKNNELSVHINVENLDNYTKVNYMIKKSDEVLSSYSEQFISKSLFDKEVPYLGPAYEFFNFDQRVRLLITNNVWMKLANHLSSKRYESFRSFMRMAVKDDVPRKIFYRYEARKRMKEEKARKKEEDKKIKRIFKEHQKKINSFGSPILM